MPTKKPIIQCVMEEDVYKKLLVICKNEERTPSKKGSMIISDYINKYESEHGKIDLPPEAR